jgi:hypothetical protein
LTIPIQVKAFRHVEPDGTATADFAADEVSEQVAGYWAVVHVPAPYDQLFPRLYLIPSIELRKRCPPVTSRMRGKSYRLTVNFAATGQDQWSDFALDIQTLESWINSIPDWSAPISPMSTMQEGSESSQIGTVGIAALSDSWALAELERAGRGRFVFAQDRTRLDTVTILAHDLSYSRFAGLHVRTGYFNTSRRTHFEVKRRHFFTSPSLYVLLLLLTPGQQVHDFCLLIPSSDIPTLGYSETITLNPLSKRVQQYRTPSEDFGAMFLQKAFNGAAGLLSEQPVQLRKAG